MSNTVAIWKHQFHLKDEFNVSFRHSIHKPVNRDYTYFPFPTAKPSVFKWPIAIWFSNYLIQE